MNLMCMFLIGLKPSISHRQIVGKLKISLEWSKVLAWCQFYQVRKNDPQGSILRHSQEISGAALKPKNLGC
jgi:hypothetical protein